MTPITLTVREEELFNFIRAVALETGTTVRVAGGYVRDKILGLESSDIDLAVDNISGLEFAKACKKRLGKGAIAVMEARPEQSKHLETARLNVMGFDIDFCGLRKETYSDTRIPIIEPGTPSEDASRRDLTINSLFYNINSNCIEDYCGGIVDLINRRARTPIDALTTFRDDPLRILRCIRFCLRFNLSVSDEIIKAARDYEVQLAFVNKISRERVFQELGGHSDGDFYKAGFFNSPNSSLAMSMIKEFGFEDIIFSPDISLNSWFTDQNSKHHDLNIYDHTCKAFCYLQDVMKQEGVTSPIDMLVLNLSMALHDLGKRDPNCIQLKDDGTNSYLGHDDRSVELAQMVLEKLCVPNAIASRVLRMVKNHMRYHNLPENPSDKSLRKIVTEMEGDWEYLIMHSIADANGKNKVTDQGYYHIFRERTKKLLAEQGGNLKAVRPINGHDLMQLGIPGGRIMGDIFKRLDEQLLDTPNMTREEALAFVQGLNDDAKIRTS